MLPAIAIFFRIVFRAKDKAYFLVIVSFMIFGCCAGISAAYCTMKCFSIAKNLKLLLQEYETVEKLFYGNAWCIGMFFGCFNVAHWLFAIIYWSLALRIECYMQEVSARSVEWIVKVVFVVGLIMNLASGVFIVIAFYRVGGIDWQFTTELANIVPNIISVAVLLDSIRRLKRASKGSLEIETWQMVWHIWSFTAVTFDGIGLSLCTRNARSNPKFFYGTYMTLVILLFCCEMPFLFIVNRIITQAII
jgi:hypothetical protein